MRTNALDWVLLGSLSVLGERLHWSDFAGMAVILAGLACVDGRLLARKRSSEPPSST